MNCVHILDIYPLLVIPFANIFSYLVGCLSVLTTVSFAVQSYYVELDGSCLFLLLFLLL